MFVSLPPNPPADLKDQWVASLPGRSPPICLAWKPLPVAMLLPVQLGVSLQHTSPTNTCQGPATSRHSHIFQ